MATRTEKVGDLKDNMSDVMNEEKDDSGLNQGVDSACDEMEDTEAANEDSEKAANEMDAEGAANEGPEKATNENSEDPEEGNEENRKDPYSYTKREEFTSEIFKIEICNLPRFGFKVPVYPSSALYFT